MGSAAPRAYKPPGGTQLDSALTQFNYFVILPRAQRVAHLHWTVTALELLWIALSIAFARLSWTEGHHEPLRPAWIAVDVSMLTSLLGCLNAAKTAMVLGYSLLIVMAGLWSRVRLVWLTTALCIAGYSTLILAANVSGDPWTTGTSSHDANVVIALLLITGYVVAVQVERTNALAAVHR